MSVKGLMPKKEAQMELLKKYLQEEKYGSLEVAVKRKEGRKKEKEWKKRCLCTQKKTLWECYGGDHSLTKIMILRPINI